MPPDDDSEKVDTRMRIPRPLYERVKALAQTDHRSINAQVIVLLEMAVRQREQEGNRRTEEGRGNSLPVPLAA